MALDNNYIDWNGCDLLGTIFGGLEERGKILVRR
jgi:hypothetical protein